MEVPDGEEGDGNLGHAIMGFITILTLVFRFWNQMTLPVLSALRPSTILEIGAGRGDHTTLLAEFAESTGAALTVVDPFPYMDTPALLRRYPSVHVLRLRSTEALTDLPVPDVLLLDGDHNYHTVLTELRMLEERGMKDDVFPVVLLHDIGWPYARRDLYSLPAAVPEHRRHPYAEGGVRPNHEHLVTGGALNPMRFHAKHEGGAKNGVLTALEDFLHGREEDFSLVMVQGFHGLAILAPRKTVSGNAELAAFLASLTVSPALQKHVMTLEKSRIDAIIQMEELRFSIDREREAAEHFREAAYHRNAEAERLQWDLGRMRRTLSWRLTLPLRTGLATLRRLRKLPASLHARRTTVVRYRSLDTVKKVKDNHVIPLSILVVARNNAPYLRACLTSILAQTVRPLEIIYYDDGSTDESVAVARSVTGVRVITAPHRGVIAARNAAVQESKGDLLLHVDGDDLLPADYVAKQWSALASSASAVFAYGGSEMFGMQASINTPQPWSLPALWKRNYINTSSIMRRSAFEAAGGWREGAGTLWDWDLWLRLSKIGPGVPSDAMLRYRRHEGSWSHQERQMDPEALGQLLGRVRRNAARRSVAAIVSGRVSGLVPNWLDAIARSIRGIDDPDHRPELVILDNSPDGSIGPMINTLTKKHEDVFRSVVIVPYPIRFVWKDEMERRHKVAMFLATAYNRLLAMTDGEIVWFMEDDVVVPEHAYRTLLHDLTDGEDIPVAVSGMYTNRHRPQLIAHRVLPDGSLSTVRKEDVSVPLDIDLAGTGCLMMLRPLTTATFSSHWRGTAPAHDWTWCQKVRDEGHRIVLDPRVECRHHTDETHYV